MSDINRNKDEAGLENGKSGEERITGIVRDFYEKIQFPGIRPPDQDGLILIRRLSQWIAQNGRHRAGKPVRVLDAGCGTGNTTVSLARQFREAEFLGIDISEASVSRANEAASKDQPGNITFQQKNLMDPLTDLGEFDIVLCLGVLHHTANMQTVLSNLHAVLSGTGELYLWVYGLHGRYRHSLNRRLLDMLLNTEPGPENKTALAKEFIFKEKTGVILDDWLGQHSVTHMDRKVLEDPTWIADQFLHPEEKLLDMEGLIRLVRSAGFSLEHWLGVNTDLSSYFQSPELAGRFGQFTGQKRLIALDFLLKRDRYFVVLRKA